MNYVKIKIAIDDPQSMSQSGESILRSLQNKTLSPADIIVRESIQNALDAAVEGKDITKVDFRLGKFKSKDLNCCFEQIDDSLNERYSDQQDFLAISDRNTIGLIGDYRSNDPEELDKSNFQKLVFDIGNNQQAKGAGGSWGMGKTSYFSIGAGIVIYYTRIQLTDGRFEERLIASLIENSKSSERLLKSSRRGIAWWGDRVENDRLFPITDHKTIEDILGIFGLQTYLYDETGTTIVVPYLKNNLVNPNQNVPWEKTFSDSIAMAVQRWYAPRLSNPIYHEATGKSILRCKLNGRNLALEMVPTFIFMQRLYNAAVTGNTDSQEPKIRVKDVILPRGFANNNTSAGRVAYMTPSVEDLEIDKAMSSPTTYITSDESEDNHASRILGMSRMPGMVVKYDINGKWSAGFKNDAGDVLAFFVPNSDQRMYKKLRNQGINDFEQYLRASEKADHADWEDSFGETIIKRVAALTADVLSSSINSNSKVEETRLSDRLARKMGRLLLNPLKGNLGTKVKREKNRDKKTYLVNHKKVSFLNLVGSEPLENNRIIVKFEGYIKNSVEIALMVQTQDGRLSQQQWQSFFKYLDFPVTIIGFSIDESELTKSISDYEIYIEPSKPIEIHGKFLLQINSPDYDVSLAITQIKEEKNRGTASGE